jgi:hypothetical protein
MSSKQRMSFWKNNRLRRRRRRIKNRMKPQKMSKQRAIKRKLIALHKRRPSKKMRKCR